MLAQTYADGDRESPVVIAALKEIVDTLEYEKKNNEKLVSPKSIAEEAIDSSQGTSPYRSVSALLQHAVASPLLVQQQSSARSPAT